MEEVTKVNGKKIIWKEWVFINGMMADLIKDSILMIRSMATEYIGGQMVVSILATGTLENSMALVYILLQLIIE